MKIKVFAVVVLLLTVGPVAAFAGTYTTDFDETDVGELSPGAFLHQMNLGGDATHAIGSSQLSLIDPTGLDWMSVNAFLVQPIGGTVFDATFSSGFDLTVVIDAASIEQIKTSPGNWTGIGLVGTATYPTVVFGPCHNQITQMLSYLLVPNGPPPSDATPWPPVPSMGVFAFNRLGGNRVAWSVPLPVTPTDTTLRVVVDGATPPNATFYVDGSPVLTNFPIGPNQIAAAGMVQQFCGNPALMFQQNLTGPVTTTAESFLLTGAEVPTYPVVPMASVVSPISLGILAVVMAALVAIIGTRKRVGARA
jgi:hypothetical protein